MTELETRLKAFRIRLLVRQVAFGALCGLVLALLLLAVAPWVDLPRWATLVAPLALPAVGALAAWVRRPDQRTAALAADAWAGAGGAVVAAWEQSSNPGPFADALARQAVGHLKRPRVPEPRWARHVLVAFVVAAALLPLTRAIEAQRLKQQEDQQRRTTVVQTDVNPDDARAIAEDAEKAKAEARELQAYELARLADDIAETARRHESGPTPKERSLRDANVLKDRVASMRETAEARAEARARLGREPVTEELARALEAADRGEVDRAIQKMQGEIFDEEGRFDPERAQQIVDAAKRASEAAPQDQNLRRAAERLAEQLSESAQQAREARNDRLEQSLQERGISEEEIRQALELLDNMDQETIRRALEGLADAADPLRDLGIDPSDIDPQQAREMMEQAEMLLERLDVDTQALLEMLREGGNFGGIDEFMRRWAETANTPGMRGEGDGGGGRSGNQPGEASGGDRGEGDDPDLDVTNYAEVEMDDTGEHRGDPDGTERELDTESAASETARREATGEESTSQGLDTASDIDRLPRRYQEAARRYFKRD